MCITQRKFNRGYTLIELSLIILLIGIILVFVLKKTPYQIVFDITNRTYSFSQINDEESSVITDSAQETGLPDRVYIKDIVMETEGKITEGKVVIRFYPDGYVEVSEL